MKLRLRRLELIRSDDGFRRWREKAETREVPPAAAALVICDMWDKHWCKGAERRVDAMAPKFDAVAKAVRAKGVLVIHAPSDTMGFYRDAPARKRATEAPRIAPPPETPHADPPLPVDAANGGCDTDEVPDESKGWPWTRQHPGIEIDQERDLVSDDGLEILSVLRARGVTQILLCGVHANFCILGRSFGIKQMVRWGVEIALIRDLTDAMHDPAQSPYVDHEEGTRLVVEFIEKFWAPTISGGDLVG